MTNQATDEVKAKIALLDWETRDRLLKRASKPLSSAKIFYAYLVIFVASLLPVFFRGKFAAYDNLWPIGLLIIGLVFAEGNRTDDKIAALIKLLELQKAKEGSKSV